MYNKILYGNILCIIKMLHITNEPKKKKINDYIFFALYKFKISNNSN